MRVPEWEPRFDEIQLRVGELLNTNGDRWKIILPSVGQLIYERGFIEGVYATSDDYFENRRVLQNAIPLREVRFTASDSTIPELLNATAFDRIPRISVDLPDQLFGVWETPVSRIYPHLLSVSIQHAGIDDVNAGRVFIPNCFADLKRLNISFNRLRRGAMATIARACPVLNELRVSASEETDYVDRMRARGAHEIATSWPGAQLRFLALAHQQIGDAGLRSLAESPHLANLEILDLAVNDIGTIGTTGIETFAASPHMRKLRWLNLRGNPIGNAGLRELVLWPTLKELRKLDLSSCNITSAGARLLANQELHPDLRLDLSGNPIGDDCMELLASRLGPRVRLASSD